MKTYIMRWNPAISSFKIHHYLKACEQWSPGAFASNWSIYEWEEAEDGDDYYMVRVGDGPNGVIHWGHIISAPYVDDDWAGDPNKKRHYVDISYEEYADDPDEPMITIEQLESILPEIDWRHGHSGQLLTPEQAEKLHASFPFE